MCGRCKKQVDGGLVELVEELFEEAETVRGLQGVAELKKVLA